MIKTRMGHRYDRALYLSAIRAERSVLRKGRISLAYTFDVHPLIVATGNREYDTIALCRAGASCLFPPTATLTVASRHTAYGFGVVPVGVRSEIRVAGPLSVAVGLSGGGSYFDRRIPDPAETRFNFIADGNLGGSLRTPVGMLTVGWRQHHFSNGYTGRVNPALDSRLMFVEFLR
jgi:hypothetical protein